MKEIEVYDKLLEKLEKDKKKYRPEDIKGEKSKYYFKNIEDNCYEEPHKKLKYDKRGRAIYSSAIMIYNLLGNKVKLNGKEYDVIYEEELEAIKPENKFRTHKAHLDASLRSNDEIIFCEAKMREYFGLPKNLAEAYLKKECYLEITDEKEKFIEIFKKIIDETKLQSNGYKSKYKKYDAIQMTIHILGIYNFVLRGKNNGIKKISLINCVWGNDEIDEYKIEKEEAKEFIKFANREFKPLFSKKGIDFKVEYYSYHELKKNIDFSNDKEREKYLERYDIF